MTLFNKNRRETAVADEVRLITGDSIADFGASDGDRAPQDLNYIVRDSLKYVALGVALLHGAAAAHSAFFLPASLAWRLATMAGVVAVVLLCLAVFLHYRPVNTAWAHPILSLVTALATFHALAYLWFTGEMRHTLVLLFILIGVGQFFLSVSWFLAALAGILLSWTAVAWQLSPSPYYFALVLLAAAGASFITFLLRRHSLARWEQLRLQDESHKAELRHRAWQLETSLAVGQHIASILDLDVLLNEVAELIKGSYRYDYVGVFLLVDNGAALQIRAGTGDEGRLLCEQAVRLPVNEKSLVGWVASNGRPVQVNDVRLDSRYVQLKPLPQIRSELDLPLQMGSNMLGVLTLQSERVAAFKSEDIPFLQLMATQVAIAIYNASLYQGEKSARRLAETLHETGRALTSTLEWGKVIDLILERLAELVPYDRASVLVQQGNELEMVAARGFPDESEPFAIRISLQNESIFRHIYETQRPLAIDDVLQRSDWQQVESIPLARAWLGVPLIHSDEVIGMLSLTREAPTPYHSEEITLAMTFAGQAAIALENARQYEKTTRFNQQLEYEVHQRTEAIQKAYLELEQLNRTKSDFITIASHELRTPLTILRGYTQMLLNDKAIQQDDTQYHLVSGIQAGSARLHEIINSMLDVARIDSRELKLYPVPVSIPDLIRVVKDELAAPLAERKLKLLIEEMADVPDIIADPEALQKVFTHLIVNAIKYTPDGGQITVSGHRLENGGLDLPAHAVEIVITDTGIGIAPHLQELVFTKFYQTGAVALHSSGRTMFKGGGPGLGLAISQGIVEAHRGKIWVESPGYDEDACPGSSFHIVLPIRQK